MAARVGVVDSNEHELRRRNTGNLADDEEKSPELLPDFNFWSVFDINANGSVSLNDLATVLFFAGFGFKMQRDEFKRVLFELHQFKVGRVQTLSQTRAAFTRLCKCNAADVEEHLQGRVDKGYRRELESLFDGNSFRYLRKRLALWSCGLSTWGLRDEFFSQELHDLREATTFFTYLGHICIALMLLPGVIQLVLYFLDPSIREAHSPGEIALSFVTYWICGLGVTVREPPWAARDLRQSWTLEGNVEWLALWYRSESTYKVYERLMEHSGVRVRMGATYEMHRKNEDNAEAQAAEQIEGAAGTYDVFTCSNLGSLLMRSFVVIGAVIFGLLPSIQREIAVGGSFYGNETATSALLILCSILSTLYCVSSWILTLQNSFNTGQTFL